jgi:hypothetical protein
MNLHVEPFTTYLWLDVLRCLIGAASLWLAALIVKLTLRRWRARNEPGQLRTHPATMVSYTLCLLGSSLRRASQLGDPFDPFMILAVLILVTGYYGVLRRVDMTLQPPWKRPR